MHNTANVTVFICSQNANAKVLPPLSELQVLNEQLFQTLAEYISSMSVLMSMNFQYILKLTLVVGYLSLSTSTCTQNAFTIAVQ